MSTILQQLQETKTYIQSRVSGQAAIGIILGSGLGNLASEIVSEFGNKIDVGIGTVIHAQQIQKASAAETPVPARAPEVVVTTTGANTVDAVETAVEEVDTSGLTAEGRAIKDPRILPKPVTDTAVQTELTQLFDAPEAPPVSVVSQNIPRASNDPRGPKAATAGK